MIVFENEGEIDPRLAMLIGVNVKETSGAIGFFGTGLKYAIACLSRWGETIVIQSGENEFAFSVEDTEIRGKTFGVMSMHSKYDRAIAERMALSRPMDIPSSVRNKFVKQEAKVCPTCGRPTTDDTDELPF